MSDQAIARITRATAPSAQAMIADYEQVLAEAVEAVLTDVLSQCGGTAAQHERVVASWRDVLMFVAAEELSLQLARSAGHWSAGRINTVRLERILRGYAPLVTTAAQTEVAPDHDTSFAAD